MPLWHAQGRFSQWQNEIPTSKMTTSKGTVKILANGVEAPEANRELFVFEKVDGEWKIARYMFNKTAPKG